MTAEFALTVDGGYTVEVSKVGGGTVGRSYGGRWLYRVIEPSGEVSDAGDDLYTGTAKTHSEAAKIVAEIILCEFA